MSNIKHPVYAIRVLRHKIAEHEQVAETINATIHGMELRGNNDVDHLQAEAEAQAQTQVAPKTDAETSNTTTNTNTETPAQ